ncbi:unnamed protein product [marine sediment metagenome]|uniref:Transcription regulator TrmB N-terminal domain-containing protein n=2 Tax=marine sediment metagenome TaxID=412755 RepID=X1RU09_9ZZZZ
MGRIGGSKIQIKNRLPPVNLNLEIKRNAKDLIEILNLSVYEGIILTILLASPRPMIASEITNFCKVPRTKVYYTLRNLVRKGPVITITIDEDLIEKPEVWEWWPDYRRNEFLRQYFIGIKIFALNHEYIRDVYYTWTTEIFQKKSRIKKVIEGIEASEKHRLPNLEEKD